MNLELPAKNLCILTLKFPNVEEFFFKLLVI
jgi:hypothetical protein